MNVATCHFLQENQPGAAIEKNAAGRVPNGSPFITPLIKGFLARCHIFCKRDMSLANKTKGDSLQMASRFYYQNIASEAVGPVGLQELLVARAAGEIRTI